MTTTRTPGAGNPWGYRLGSLAACLAVVMGACTGSAATPTPAPTASVAAATATAVPTAAPTPTPTPTPTPAPTAPGRLCTGAEQVSAVTIWHVVTGGTEIDFLTGSHSSSTGETECYLHGTSEGQVVAGGAVVGGFVTGGTVIADSGTATAVALDSDPYVLMTPGDKVYSSVLWSNWCGKAPSQPITVAFVLPGGLGRVLANTNAGMPAPPCVSSGTPSTVTATAPWYH